MCNGRSSLPRTHAKSKVLLFRNELLPASETFILAQAGAMRVFEPHFAGVHRSVASLDLPSDPILLDSSSNVLGKIRRRLFWSSSLGYAFYRNLEQLHPDLIHAHFAVDGAAALSIAKHLRIPLVVTLHGYDVTSSDNALSLSAEGRRYLRYRERLCAQASVFLCISRFLYDRALAAGFPKEKLRVHYTGTDLRLFTQSYVERDPNLIVFVGRLVEKKGCRYLLDALELVRQRHPEVHMVCLGDGPLRPALEAQVAATHLPCTFLGSQPAEVVRETMARARIFCVPSVEASTGDSEGLGMVFIEAQAMGTPVVSFRHGGIPEVVLHGRTGFLAPERDRDLLACYLLKLLQDEGTWQALSERGPRWAASTFDLRTQTLELENIYSELVNAA